MITFFGTVHSDGGCGPELLGAIELLRIKNVAVRLIVPKECNILLGLLDYLNSLRVDLSFYEPGMFKTCKVLVSFAEGEDLFRLIKQHDDRPKWVVYSDCMHFPSDDEIGWFKEGLIDEFFHQTRALADKHGPAITKRAEKPIFGRHGYKAFINPQSDFFPLRFYRQKPRDIFTVLKVGRDHAEKWHPDSWRMFCGINAPANRPVQIEVAGWGQSSSDKVGNIDSPDNKWNTEINVQLHSHIYDLNKLADLYNRSHALVHVCDPTWEEAMARVFLESIVAGVIIITDNRGGATQLIRNGETGFLVDSSDEAAFYASHLAFNDRLRSSIASQAYVDLITAGHGNVDVCYHWWKELVRKSNA